MTGPWGTPGKPFQRALAHWRRRQQESQTPAEEPKRIAFTIAISRERGAGGSAVANELGRRLEWPVYDRALLEEIANTAGIRTQLVESVDEKQTSWLTQCLEEFGGADAVSQMTYFRHLRQVLCSLSAHGECIIVGRGAAHLLPPETTLRVMLVASLKDRIARVAREQRVSQNDAKRHVEETDREREDFVRERCRKTLSDMHQYDIVINTSHFGYVFTADIIQTTLERLQTSGRSIGENLTSAGQTAAKTQAAID